MKIPTRFEIEGHVWRVRFVKRVDKNDNPGETIPHKRLIRIQKGLELKHRVWVFWHEYAHAWFHEKGVAREDCGLPLLVEEMLCDSFADLLTIDKVIKFKRRRK